MKKQVKKYVGWVPARETLKDTLYGFECDHGGMFSNKKYWRPWETGPIIKRTITITSEDEDGSTKTRKAKKKGKKKVIASPIVNKKSR
jgi:hypothetical protein